MATWGPRLIDSEEAAALADLVGVKHDLETAAALCDVLAEADRSSASAYLVVDALSTAVLVSYSRCFAEGVRKRLNDNIIVAELPEHLRELHRFVRLVRDKYIAHSVNALEENIVTVHVREPPDPPAIGGIGFQQARSTILNAEIAAQVKELCKAVAAYVDRRIAEQEAAVKREIEGLPVERIYSFPKPALRLPDWEKIHEPRRKK